MGIVARGAEAVISKKQGKLFKERAKKGYRHPELDLRLRMRRTRLEANALKTALRAGALVPKVISVDEKNCSLELEELPGTKLRDCFSISFARKLGNEVAKIHSAGIVHGDITTSNIIAVGKDPYLIDFGLAKFSKSDEDRAVDLNVFRQALESTHTKDAEKFFSLFLSEYGKKFPETLKRLGKVQGRGRYK